MEKLIHARLDEGTEDIRLQLARQLGWSDSRIVREGIRALTIRLASRRKRKIVGLGKFSSGVPDLGSNKAHLDGLGK